MTSLADLERARAAHTNHNGTVVITRPTPRWPFITSPDSKDATVTQPSARDRSGTWLRNAMLALGLLAVCAAVVSFAAQYQMVYAAKQIRVIAALEAAIPDAAALIFACLGIALALQGKHAIRARALNIGAVGTSITMNYLAAAHGWRDAAIWVMPPVAYALASDTAIGVVRAWAIARQRQLDDALADDEATPLAILGRMALYALRLMLAPASTAKGLRRALLNSTPLPATDVPAQLQGSAPAALASSPFAGGTDAPPRSRKQSRRARPSGPTKAEQLVTRAAERRDLATMPLDQVSSLAGEIAVEIGLHAGTARRVLLGHVRALQNGGQPS